MYDVHVRIHLVLVGFSEITSRLIVQGSFIYVFFFFQPKTFSIMDIFVTLHYYIMTVVPIDNSVFYPSNAIM